MGVRVANTGKPRPRSHGCLRSKCTDGLDEQLRVPCTPPSECACAMTIIISEGMFLERSPDRHWPLVPLPDEFSRGALDCVATSAVGGAADGWAMQHVGPVRPRAR